ncbi:sugar phosphate isomerase/epimerase family protein [Chthonomonas calidirosea]|uniref:sugar phosphate isomerase/epimerase family protein n=1 Tax=Chthonomonas calidirosea TaxID=454171 RepID=UPI0006EC58D7|nr:sugar phosphate isomerase/epimerase family protein [Chthonomonas calidirosea]CEK17947.1 sugar phosphate isomerase/epimerase [Chthonomonas calidirosea]
MPLIGINAWSLPSGLPLHRAFEMAKAAGFDCVEVNLAEEGEVSLQLDERSARRIAEDAARCGIKLLSLSTGLGWKYPIAAPDPTLREKGFEVVRCQLQVAHWLGADTALVVPGVVTPDSPYDVVYRLTLEGLKRLAPEAERFGVHIGVENVWNRFLLSPLEFAQLLDAVAHPYVGAYFDVGNVLAFGYPDQWIRILNKRIRKVHVKDFRTTIGNINGFCNPAQGDVPWERVGIALQEIGYDGPITAEVEGYRTLQTLGLKHIAETLRLLFTPAKGAEV